MLPQEKLAHKLIFERFTLYYTPWFLTKEVETAMDECGLKYRAGRGYIDLLGAVNRHGEKSISEWLENGAERIDKVVTIDWSKRYGKYVGGITIL